MLLESQIAWIEMSGELVVLKIHFTVFVRVFVQDMTIHVHTCSLRCPLILSPVVERLVQCMRVDKLILIHSGKKCRATSE